MIPKDHLQLTREELHDLVWAKPMTQVAKDFQISDRALAKICARKQVPVPPRGYWAKKSAGKDALNPRCLSSSRNLQKKKRESDAGAASGNETQTPQCV
jgi:hypothetical protein